MSDPQFPDGWDADRVQKLINYYDGLTEDEEVADEEAAMADQSGQTVITIPEELLPAVRQLLAAYKIA